jgi:geranylgeranyl pyrophosphate synthase
MVHTYSLIHDDLPAMDDDDFRRGKPTCHRAFGEATAILAGDALLTAAPAVLANGIADPRKACRLVSELAAAAGSEGMVGGQAADLHAEGRDAGEEDIRYIHEHKTAALIAWCCRAGAICASASEDRVDAFGRYGRGIGLAFQIVDDLLDVQGDGTLMGKAAGKDIARGKAIYLVLVSDCEWNRSFHGSRSGREEVRAFFETSYRTIGSPFDTTLVALGDSKGATTDNFVDRIVRVSSEELKKPEAVAKKIGTYVASRMAENRGAKRPRSRAAHKLRTVMEPNGTQGGHEE